LERTVATSPVSSCAVNPNQSQGGDPWRQFRQLVSPVSLADPNAPGATLDVIA